MYIWVYIYITGHNNVIQPIHTGFTWHGDYLYPLAVMPTCAILYLLSMFFFKNICGLHFLIYNLHVDVRREKVGFRNCFFDHAFSIANYLMQQNCPQGQVEFLEGNTNNSVV